MRDSIHFVIVSKSDGRLTSQKQKKIKRRLAMLLFIVRGRDDIVGITVHFVTPQGQSLFIVMIFCCALVR